MEAKVLDCLGRGIRQYEIATFLGISRSNVSNCATRLADKLCLASRADLVSFARRAAMLQRVGQ
jgi:DNA-binding NarL/FixJ family response regulator